MNTKRLFVVALLVFCCVGMIFAQGTRVALEERGLQLVKTSNGFELRQLVLEEAISEDMSVQAEKHYSLVGYEYKFALKGNSQIEFSYLDYKTAEALVKAAPSYVGLFDYVSDAQVEKIEEALCGILSVPSTAAKTAPGVIAVTYKKAITEAQFNEFVEEAEKLIYDTIY